MKHTEELSTEYMLAMRYRSPCIELSEVCRNYFSHLSTPEAINRKASKQEFPFPVFRAEPKNKRSPYLVKISALAYWLDTQAEQGAHEWQKVNG